MIVRPVLEKDYETIRKIYNRYIEESTATLEFDALTAEEFAKRTDRIRERYPYLVCEDKGKVIGYAYLDEYGERRGYRYTASETVYIDIEYTGRGAGKALVSELMNEAKKMGLKDIVAKVTDENMTSFEFHKAMGFEEAGHLEGIADKFGKRFGLYHMLRRIS